MPEENWAAHGGIPACDLCHSRKVKCDRKVPCSTCQASKTECLRTRPKRTPRPRIRTDDKIRALVEKLSSLEDAMHHGVTLPTPSIQGTNTTSLSLGDVELSPRLPKRMRTGDHIPTQDVLSPPDSVASQQQRTNEARALIEKELSYNQRLVGYQRNVLETALSFVDQLSRGSSMAVENDVWSLKVSTDLSSGELVQIIAASQRKEQESSEVQLHTLDHIPPEALERMAVGLLEGTADTRTLNMYTVIVHFKAALNLYASQLQAPKGPAIREHIKKMQLHHLNAALTALDRAILMHIVGNSTSCWSLTAHASRTLVALGYHTLSEPILDSSEEEIHAAVAWCYHFDRLMSLLLLRPPSLPSLDVPISALIKHSSTNPMSIFATVMLEMVPIHEKILELTLGGFPERATGSQTSLKAEVDQLRNRMTEVYAMMEKSRPMHQSESNVDYLLHWQSLEFKYFSTLTAVHRLSPTVTSEAWEREQCLQCARRALRYVKSIQLIGKQQGHFVEEYSPYLSWTILSYPLCPFFVLFCNVVGTSNLPDFQLLQDVVDSVSSLVIENKYVERLHRLCNTMLALCKPLVQQSAATLHNLGPAEMSPNTTILDNLSVGNRSDILVAAELSQPTEELPMASWDDELMWQLFQCQPSLDWYNSDILDPASWELNTDMAT